jgi:hypothetical protein
MMEKLKSPFVCRGLNKLLTTVYFIQSLIFVRMETEFTYCCSERRTQSSLDKELYPHDYLQRVDVVVHAGHNLKKSLYLKRQ